ncbi:SET and MYND domain-containing protein 4-like [Trichogramma pretiosum]|uniref:SET and MYND domain-containing protein 4-like n=1 Tax=Trichogramma pretiosum TaxID=7493 RepID=UPI0006C9BF18|nr:SET and MYND domain-containing protein 4-like [Trichogramma pretiosum]
MEKEEELLIKTFKSHKSKIERIFKEISTINPKNSKESKEARIKGNNLYIKGKHTTLTHRGIFHFYCQSIALAPKNSKEEAQALGNLSAFLLHIEKLQESIQIIDRALAITQSQVLRVKLLCRKAECLAKLGSSKYESVLEEAQMTYDSISDSENEEKCKLNIKKLIEKVKNTGGVTNEIFERKDHKDALNLLAKIEQTSIKQAVSVDYNEKYGRHLIAQKDFKPGDVIYVEKIYAAVTDSDYNFSNCNNCSLVPWTSVPCDYCTWAVYCSENCKKVAWEKHHDIECSVMPNAFKLVSNYMMFYHVCIRMLIQGLKESGSIDQLKKDLKSVEDCSDVCSRGFSEDETFSTFKSIYSLIKCGYKYNSSYLDMMAEDSWIILIILIKLSPLPEKEIDLTSFVLMKLCYIKHNNTFIYSPNEDEDPEPGFGAINQLKDETSRVVIPLTSLINHSCFPNAKRYHIQDQKVALCALQPIGKGSQLFISYTSMFFTRSYEDRKMILEKYNFECDCQPCIEKWPPILLPILDCSLNIVDIAKSSIEREILKTSQEVFTLYFDKKYHLFDRKAIETLSKAVEKSLETLPQPSILTCYMIECLQSVLTFVYGHSKRTFEMDCMSSKTAAVSQKK